MKTIKSIKQLQSEIKRSHRRREELEQKFRSNWSDLKECLKPVNIAADTLNETIKNKTAKNLHGDSILKNTFAYGITLLANKIIDKAGDKLGRIFKK